MKFRALLALFLVAFVACQTNIKPTPLLYGDLVEANNTAHVLITNCLEEFQFKPTKPGCEPVQLDQQLQKVKAQAKVFIAQDIRQPHGYDIYLASTMIYFSVAVRTANEYTEAEKIARQFFEVQKATSGQALDEARYYWAMLMAENLAFQFNNAELILDDNRRTEITVCIHEALAAVEKMPEGVRRINLILTISILQEISQWSA